MESEFNYEMAADYTIRQLGGEKEVIRRLEESRTKFITHLQDCSARWWDIKPDAVMLYDAILVRLKPGMMMDELNRIKQYTVKLKEYTSEIDTVVAGLMIQ